MKCCRCHQAGVPGHCVSGGAFMCDFCLDVVGYTVCQGEVVPEFRGSGLDRASRRVHDQEK